MKTDTVHNPGLDLIVKSDLYMIGGWFGITSTDVIHNKCECVLRRQLTKQESANTQR